MKATAEVTSNEQRLRLMGSMSEFGSGAQDDWQGSLPSAHSAGPHELQSISQLQLDAGNLLKGTLLSPPWR